jgi:ABC-type multidrug transport system fused ATPase/permease subunit
MKILRLLKIIYKLFPPKFENKSIFFIVLLIFAAVLETIGIGILFPVIDFLIKGEFSRNYIGINLEKISLYFDSQITIKDLILFIIFLYLFKTIFLILSNYWQIKFSQNTFKHLTLRLFSKYLFNPILFYHKKNTSILLRNTLYESRNYGNCVNLILKLIAEFLIVLFIFSLLVYVEPIATSLMTLILLTFVALYYFVTSKKIYKLGEIKSNSQGKLIKIISESFNGIRDIKLKGAQYFFFNIHKRQLDKFIKSSNYQQAIVETPRILFEFILIFLLLTFLYFYLNLNKNVLNLLPLLSVYLISAIKLIPCIIRILNMLQTIKGLEPSIIILNKELIDNKNLNNSLKLQDLSSNKFLFNNKIEFKNVSFSYDNKNKIINNFSKVIHKNKIIGVFGQSGSGKSTIIDLLTGLVKPNSGNILIDGEIDINDGFLLDWQYKIGYVSQSIFLLDASIRENIAFGLENENIDNLKVIKVLKQAQLYDHISKLEKGLDTIVGERGINLSGGQIQRIGIARELYREPELLILDESTSAVDSDTENKILECIKGLKKKMTIIIVSHKKKTLSICDEILKFI